MTRQKRKSKLWLRILIFALLIVALGFAVTVLSIEVRYRASEKNAVNTESEYNGDYYYFNKLSYKEQLLFKEIKNAADNVKNDTEILPYRYTKEEFERTVLAVRFDCPLLFYINYNNTELFSDRYKTSVKLDYFESAQNIKSMKMELEAASAAAVAFTQNAATEFEKAVILHDFLTKNCTKSTKNSNEEYTSVHTVIGALVDKKALCDGYSAALKVLLNRCGIECIVAEGVSNSQPHVWNIAKLDGYYYHIDPIWNDSDLDFASDLAFHGYFALSDSDISSTHTLSSTFELPKCENSDNYYAKINSVVTKSEDFDSVAYSQIKNAIEKKQPYFELDVRYTNNDEDFKGQLLSVLDKVNSEFESAVLSRSFRSFNATDDSHMKTIQIYYLKK